MAEKCPHCNGTGYTDGVKRYSSIWEFYAEMRPNYLKKLIEDGQKKFLQVIGIKPVKEPRKGERQ